MASEYPPLNKIYVFGYSANDRDFPILSATADPRVAGYQVPKDLSACPDKRYPNHVFTGAQPISGDQRVRHVWEILPSPWVPFTRYDDDLGPVQGRRRSVKNDGQVAILTAETRTTYEAREGSAIVYNELEETWSIATDEDGNSLFPVRDRDFYDPSRGPVQERRQLFVPTGEEEGSLENVNGVITQTSYEPYNQFLSFKIVQTYKVDGPQLIGKATNNEGQLVTITTQRKAADSYIPPSPTATRTVEAAREDAESLVERITDIPEVFSGESYQKTKADLTPQKFRAAQEDATFEQTIAGTAESPTLATGEFAKSEQQITKFVKRVSTTSRAITEATTLLEKVLTPEGKIGTRTLTLASGDQSFIPSATLIDANVEALGDGRTVKTETTIPQIFSNESISVERPDPVPQKFRVNNPIRTTQLNVVGVAEVPSLSGSEISKSEQQVTDFVKRISTTTRSGSSTIASLEGQVYTSELGGGIATVSETVANSPVIDPDTGTISSEKENLGNGQFYVRQVKLATPLPELRGQDYDDTFDVTIPFTRQFVEAGTEDADGASTIEPRDTLHSVNNTIDIEAAKERLLEVLYVTGDRQTVQLPDVLTDITMYVDYATEGDNSNSTGNSATAAATVGVNANVDLLYNINDGYNGPADAQRYLFFLPKEECGLTEILAKLGGATRWPVVRPKSERILVRFTTERKFTSFQLSLPNNRSISTSVNKSPQTTIFPIPATLHGDVQIQTITQGSNTVGPINIGVSSPVHGSIGTSVSASATLGETVSTIEATSPESFPTGRYLYSVNTTPYRFGLVRVDAIVVEITEEMVA